MHAYNKLFYACMHDYFMHACMHMTLYIMCMHDYSNGCDLNTPGQMWVTVVGYADFSQESDKLSHLTYYSLD